METGQKILVALDDSENAIRAVEHVSKFFNPSNNITLFSVLQDTVTLFNMNHPELTPYFMAQQTYFGELEEKQKSIVEEAQKKAKKILLDAGFNEENITVKSQHKQKGIARDIIEAASGYDIIVMGRRGLSGIQEFLLGSVSHKVLHSVKNISVLIVN
ncbi:MAG: universal stress protein [Deltaproteobacteria bacterium]|nr:universal stress protein [Deltaproteobacteria bacterium]